MEINGWIYNRALLFLYVSHAIRVRQAKPRPDRISIAVGGTKTRPNLANLPLSVSLSLCGLKCRHRGRSVLFPAVADAGLLINAVGL